MLQKVFQTIIIGLLYTGTLFGQGINKDTVTGYQCYVGSTFFLLGNFSEDSPSFFQLNFGYRITQKDVISLEAITWKYDAPLGIPYGPSFGDKSENYPGSIREYGIGVVYQRFLLKGLYTSLQALPLKRIYLDENNKKIQAGFQLFSTFRIGYHLSFFKNRFFIEPSVACTFWPVSTNVPDSFAEKDEKWNKYFLGEPGLHFGVNF